MAEIIEFFSAYNRPKATPFKVGDGTAPIFEERIVDGVRVLIECGRNPLNEFVQSSLEETRIYNIISRYQRGDETALNKVAGQYMDVVGMPTNLQEAQNALLNIERNFNTLPSEIKAEFDNNVNQFVKVVSEGKLNDVLQKFVEPTTQPIVKDGDVNAE